MLIKSIISTGDRGYAPLTFQNPTLTPLLLFQADFGTEASFSDCSAAVIQERTNFNALIWADFGYYHDLNY